MENFLQRKHAVQEDICGLTVMLYDSHFLYSIRVGIHKESVYHFS